MTFDGYSGIRNTLKSPINPELLVMNDMKNLEILETFTKPKF
jgi:hypothetical protein